MELVLEYSLEDSDKIAKEILENSKDKKLFLFTGEMGAGKTTLIKSICLNLGITENVSSPTYSIVNVYNSIKWGDVFHFDLFRLKSEMEAEDIGFSEYLDSGSYCIIEWPEMAPNLLRGYESCDISLKYLDSKKRQLTFIC